MRYVGQTKSRKKKKKQTFTSVVFFPQIGFAMVPSLWLATSVSWPAKSSHEGRLSENAFNSVTHIKYTL